MNETQLALDSTVDAATRRRTYAWQDPTATVAVLGERAGIDVLHGMLAGELPPPPVMATLGIEAVTFEVGRAAFALQPAEMHYNPLGSVHGGVIATILDSALGCAVHSVLPQGSGYTSVDLATKFLRPVTERSGRIEAEGHVVSRGSRTVLAVAELRDGQGRLLAHATSTCLVFDLHNAADAAERQWAGGVRDPSGGGAAGAPS